MPSECKNSSHLATCGMPFIYIRIRSDPKMDPWGIPHKSRLGSEKYLFEITLNFLYHRYDVNQRMKPLEKLKNSILLIRIS